MWLPVALIVACGGRTDRGTGDGGAGGADDRATTAVAGAQGRPDGTTAADASGRNRSEFDLEGYWAAANSPDITCTVLDTYAVGDTVEIEVAVENPTDSLRKGRLDVGIGVDNAMTMVAIDDVLPVGDEALTLGPNSSETFTFEYALPVSLSSNEPHCAVVLLRYDDDDIDNVATRACFELTTPYEGRLVIPEDLRACAPNDPCEFELDVVVENLGSVAITGLVFELELPFGVQTLSGGKDLVLTHDELLSGQIVTKTAELKVVEPNEAANFVVRAESDNGGSVRLSRTVEIAPR